MKNPILHCFFSLLFALNFSAYGKWSHAEYGAGNYGPPGSKGYPWMPRRDGQFQRLYEQIDQLVKQRGPEGIFYLNDLSTPDTSYAAEKLREYCARQGYTKVVIDELPGDYTRMVLPETDTAALRNPEPDFFFWDDRGPAHLRRLANHSRNGLTLVTLFHQKLGKSPQWKSFKMELEDSDAPPYLYPDGSAQRNFGDDERGPEVKPTPYYRYRILPDCDHLVNGLAESEPA